MKQLKAIIILLIFVLNSCNTLKMTTEEKLIINNGDNNQPLKVLKITNKQDSLFLRKKSVDLDFQVDRLLIDKLIVRLDTTMKLEGGVGIAAPQVGISRKLFIFTRIDKKDSPVEVAINPKIVKTSDETVCFERDGCLSIPKQRANTLRYKWIDVEYLNKDGKLVKERLSGYSRKDNFTGIIFQHEFDHLNGVLYIDRKL